MCLVRRLFCILLLLWPAAAGAAERLVTLGGDVTEIVFALGEGGRIVATDETATFPAETAAIPKVGYLRNLSAEGIIAQGPDLILAAGPAGPPPVIAQLMGTGVALEIIAAPENLDGVIEKVMRIGALLGREAEAGELAAAIRRRMAVVEAAVATRTARPRVLFVLSTGQGGTMASGTGTAADAMIALAGGRNAITSYARYKPLSPEAAVAAAPDVILVPAHVVAMLGGAEAVAALPEIALTPAGQAGRIVVMDSLLLLGFGPRTPEAVAELAEALHPGLDVPAP